jgi:predicted N-acyltransferase
LLHRPDASVSATSAALLEAIAAAADAMHIETTHITFPDATDLAALRADPDWLLRCDCQFHWENRGYRDFDDFLATFTAEKRKKARRERRRVAESGIHFERRFGHEATSGEIERAWQLHRRTFLQRGNEPYLNLDAFHRIAATMGEALQFTFACLGDEIVAVAVFFVGKDTLYGRYWGSAEEYHSLHFETCYHQGIEFCIERGLQRFEPGTQGEHKVSRGFSPTFTWSAHRIIEPRFRAAIADYLAREKIGVEQYAAGIAEHVPYKQDLAP